MSNCYCTWRQVGPRWTQIGICRWIWQASRLRFFQAAANLQLLPPICEFNPRPSPTVKCQFALTYAFLSFAHAFYKLSVHILFTHRLMIGPNSHSLHQHTPCLYTASMCSIYLVGASTLKVHFLLAPFPLKYFMCFPFTYFSGHYVPEIFHPLFTHKLLTHSSTLVDAFIHKLLHLPCWRTFYSRPFPSPLLRAFHPRAFPDSPPLRLFTSFHPLLTHPLFASSSSVKHLTCWFSFYSHPCPAHILRAFHQRIFQDGTFPQDFSATLHKQPFTQKSTLFDAFTHKLLHLLCWFTFLLAPFPLTYFAHFPSTDFSTHTMSPWGSAPTFHSRTFHSHIHTCWRLFEGLVSPKKQLRRAEQGGPTR